MSGGRKDSAAEKSKQVLQRPKEPSGRGRPLNVPPPRRGYRPPRKPANLFMADRFTSYATDLQRVSASIQKDAKKIIERAQLDLIDELRRTDPTTVQRLPYRRARLKALLANTRIMLGEAMGEVRQHVLSELSKQAVVDAATTINTINLAVGVEIAATGMTPAQIRAIASNMLIQGAPSAEWWKRQAARTQERFADQIRQGMLQGESIEQLTTRVRGIHTGRRVAYTSSSGRVRYTPEFRGGILEGTQHQVAMIVRTSVATVNGMVREAVLRDNDDIVKGFKLLATLDGRTSTICRAYSGKTWNLDGKPLGHDLPMNGGPPYHWGCRSTLTPLLKSWEELSDADREDIEEALPAEDLPKTQASMDGQVPGDMNYEQWLKTKSPGFQKQVLGPGKWKLWNEGKLTMSQMLDQSQRPLSVAALQELYG